MREMRREKNEDKRAYYVMKSRDGGHFFFPHRLLIFGMREHILKQYCINGFGSVQAMRLDTGTLGLE